MTDKFFYSRTIGIPFVTARLHLIKILKQYQLLSVSPARFLYALLAVYREEISVYLAGMTISTIS